MQSLQLTLNSRTSEDEPIASHLSISTEKIAVIVCDMWDAHWCRGASHRVDEIAPAMDRLIHTLRDSGAFIIHAPSETMAFYEGTPGRSRAQTAPSHSSPSDLSHWRRIDPLIEGDLPIDDSDSGCDDLPPCPVLAQMPWTRQHAAIEIVDEDAITDSGPEVYNLLREHEIEFVLMMGVHTNMCVLGRPFGIRRLVEAGIKIALVRDMTDTMYNSRMPPFVSHFKGTDLVIAHIERYWCPTITSDQILGGKPFHFAE